MSYNFEYKVILENKQMAEYLTDAKIRQYSELFATLDYFSYGYISSKSVFEVLRSMQLRVTHEDVVQLIKETGNQSQNYNQVQLSEFLTIISIIIEDKDMNKQIFQLFDLFDTDKNKIINRDDFETGFKHLQTKLSEEDILKLIESTGKQSFNLRQFRKYLLQR